MRASTFDAFSSVKLRWVGPRPAALLFPYFYIHRVRALCGSTGLHHREIEEEIASLLCVCFSISGLSTDSFHRSLPS